MIPIDSIPSRDLAAKAKKLLKRLEELQPGLVAVSGGIDSRALYGFARAAGLDFLPLFFSGPHLSPGQIEQGRSFVASCGDIGRVLDVDPLREEAVRANERTRCYHCKRLLFTRAGDLAQSLGRPGLAEGSHAGDQSAYRPGRRALLELGVASPLAEAGLDKPQIRELAEILQLPQPDQASGPCLLTRFAYTVEPTRDMLDRVGRFEDALRELGFGEFRLRVLQDGSRLLQIARDEEELFRRMKPDVEQALSRHGLDPCPVRITSSLSGFFDRE